MTLIANLDTAHATTSLQQGPNRRTSARSIASFLRGSTVTAYAAGDVIGTTASGALEFPNCAIRKGGGGEIFRVSVAFADNPATDPDLELYIFDEEPTNHADDAAIALVDADLPKLIQILDLTAASVKVIGSDQLFYPGALETDRSYVCELTGTSLYGLLVTRTIFTPEASFKVVCNLDIQRD